MKLLITTQKVDINDDILGFFHGWIAEFAKHCDKLTVICLQKGEYDLPDNVKVLSLGKEKLLNCYIAKLLYCLRFYKYIWKERKNYNKVFIHMNPEYAVLGGLFWKLAGKKIGLWYAHKAVNLKLIIAEKLADVIFTASKESFRLPSKKVMVTGHGIDIFRFQISDFRFQNNKEKFKIISVGRISPIKGYETLIMAVGILCRNKALSCYNLQVEIIGGPAMPEDEKYLADLKEMVKEKKLDGIINFIGAVRHKDVIKYYNDADLFINLCPTGGMDKAVLEAMAYGLPVVVFNKTFVDVLGDYKDDLILTNKNETELAEKIEDIMNMDIDEREQISKELREIVVNNHSLSKLIQNIIKAYNELYKYGKASRKTSV